MTLFCSLIHKSKFHIFKFLFYFFNLKFQKTETTAFKMRSSFMTNMVEIKQFYDKTSDDKIENFNINNVL